MKKNYFALSITAFVLCFLGFSPSASAQIPNPSFEHWTAGSPDGWYSTSSSSFPYLTQSAQSHQGTSAVQFSAISFAGSYLTGSLITGDANRSLVPCGSRPAALHFWYIQNAPASEYVFVNFLFIKNGGAFGGASGQSNQKFAGTNTVFKEGIINTQFLNAGNADSMLISFLPSAQNSSTPLSSAYYFILDDLSFGAASSGSNGINDQDATVADLEQNYPNPSGTATNIKYTLTGTSKVSLNIYDMMGRLVHTAIDGETQTAGHYKAIVDLSTLEAGQYTYTLSADGVNTTRHMCVVK